MGEDPGKRKRFGHHDRKSRASVFTSVFRCTAEDSLENVNIAGAGKDGISCVWVVLTW